MRTSTSRLFLREQAAFFVPNVRSHASRYQASVFRPPLAARAAPGRDLASGNDGPVALNSGWFTRIAGVGSGLPATCRAMPSYPKGTDREGSRQVDPWAQSDGPGHVHEPGNSAASEERFTGGTAGRPRLWLQALAKPVGGDVGTAGVWRSRAAKLEQRLRWQRCPTARQWGRRGR